MGFDVNVLREALPYINRFKGKTFVVKFGGKVAADEATLDSFCEELALCAQIGIRVVVVHGGGIQANELSRQLGIKPKTINGRRVTDERTLDVVKMVFGGKVNVEILGALRQAGVPAVGLSGVDGNILTARKRPPQVIVNLETGKPQTVDYGYVGEILDVNTRLLDTLIEKDFVPVMASLAADEDGDIYNVNADTVAAAIAAEMRAEKLVLATNVDGVLDERGERISRMTLHQAAALMAAGRVAGGMLPKLEAAARALRSGVRSVHIINGMKAGALLREIFTEEGDGTMLTVNGYHGSAKHRP
ncbi:MAG: acetylglutamate kinase [Chloracidobacterium sp.]|nr:acetylglutamate kinase [Chloracidobacterium sp.]MDW8218633.1 acetylglutamate kinase [Acidobacteriota bacterium]